MIIGVSCVRVKGQEAGWVMASSENERWRYGLFHFTFRSCCVVSKKIWGLLPFLFSFLISLYIFLTYSTFHTIFFTSQDKTRQGKRDTPLKIVQLSRKAKRASTHKKQRPTVTAGAEQNKVKPYSPNKKEKEIKNGQSPLATLPHLPPRLPLWLPPPWPRRLRHTSRLLRPRQQLHAWPRQLPRRLRRHYMYRNARRSTHERTGIRARAGSVRVGGSR